jgi:hypothetical protein
MIKNFLIFVLILGMIILLGIGYFKPTLFMGDNAKTKEVLENRNDSKNGSTIMSSLDFYSSSNIISLLSIKYSLSPEILVEILSECGSQAQLDYDIESFKMAEIKNKMKSDIVKTNDNLTNIANNYNIQPTTLANILIDYKLLKDTNR